MHAVVQSGGSQYRVKVEQVLKVEKIVASVGDTVQLDRVFMVADQDDIKIGTPYIEGATVAAEVVSHGRRKKIKSLNFVVANTHLPKWGTVSRILR